ncbi:MAG: PrsW family intramembrane metalloprotease [Anaerolineae bacterium]|nr:PrsW family intramembrane metalloprotease [Anaerolineae bacterium]
MWLAEAGFFTRVLGYTCTVGVTSELLKYIAIRYTIFPSRIRTRLDGLAYSVAASVGYAAVLNLHLVFDPDPTVTADAQRIAINFISQVGFGLIMGFFLGELALHDRPALFLGAGLALGALANGLYIAFRAIAAGSGFSVSNLNGLILVVFFVLGVALAVNFLIRTFDARDAALQGERQMIS